MLRCRRSRSDLLAGVKEPLCAITLFPGGWALSTDGSIMP